MTRSGRPSEQPSNRRRMAEMLFERRQVAFWVFPVQIKIKIKLRNRLDSFSMAASSPAAAGASPGRVAGDPPAAVAATATARTAACPCPVCLEAFKDEAYLDTCFRKSCPLVSHSKFSPISGIKLASTRYAPTN